MYGWKPPRRALAAEERLSKLIVTPPGRVGRSVRGVVDRQQAVDESRSAGLDPDLLERHDARITHTHRRINAVVVEVSERRRTALERALRRQGCEVERSAPVAPMLDQSVPQMCVDAAWQSGVRGKGISVGVADTGVDASHPDFKDRVFAYEDFTQTNRVDTVGHGTHVCGIIAGAGNRYRGVAPAASLVVAKVLTEEGGDTAGVIAGLSWLSQRGVHVINVSLGGSGSPNDALSRECEALVEDGIVICVAAGNEGPAAHTISSPGCAPSVITVGAVDKNDALARYSSRGPVRIGRKTIVKPDVLAVGGGVAYRDQCLYLTGIVSAKSHKMEKTPCDVAFGRSSRRYVRMSGTSMATPHVTGVVALLMESARAQGTPCDPGTIKEILRGTCKKLKYRANEQGAGRVDADSALDLTLKRAAPACA